MLRVTTDRPQRDQRGLDAVPRRRRSSWRLFSLLVLGLLHLAMARIAAPLARLGAGFEAVGGGDYAARVAANGPREISASGGRASTA